jgi:cytochrome subunit of sulfide dehydrogenase
MLFRLLAALVCTLMQAGAAHAADPPPGVSSCSGCHALSPSLKTSIPSPIPSLVGRSAAEIAGVMREFKSGARPATVMGRIAKGFGDADIDAMAEWLTPPGK